MPRSLRQPNKRATAQPSKLGHGRLYKTQAASHRSLLRVPISEPHSEICARKIDFQISTHKNLSHFSPRNQVEYLPITENMPPNHGIHRRATRMDAQKQHPTTAVSKDLLRVGKMRISLPAKSHHSSSTLLLFHIYVEMIHKHSHPTRAPLNASEPHLGKLPSCCTRNPSCTTCSPAHQPAEPLTTRLPQPASSGGKAASRSGFHDCPASSGSCFFLTPAIDATCDLPDDPLTRLAVTHFLQLSGKVLRLSPRSEEKTKVG